MAITCYHNIYDINAVKKNPIEMEVIHLRSLETSYTGELEEEEKECLPALKIVASETQ